MEFRWQTTAPTFFDCFFVLLLSLAWRLVRHLCHVVPVPPVHLLVLAHIVEAPPVVRGGPGLPRPTDGVVPPACQTVLGAGGTSHSNNSLVC